MLGNCVTEIRLHLYIRNNLQSLHVSVLLTPNIARNGTATQITDFHHSMHPTPDYASFAIDGNFDTSARYANGQCAITLNNYNGNWWQVEFDGIYSVLKVAITTRNGFGMINQ